MARLIQDVRRAETKDADEIWLFWHTHSDETKLFSTLHDPQVTDQDLQTLQGIFSAKQLRHYGFSLQ